MMNDRRSKLKNLQKDDQYRNRGVRELNEMVNSHFKKCLWFNQISLTRTFSDDPKKINIVGILFKNRHTDLKHPDALKRANSVMIYAIKNLKKYRKEACKMDITVSCDQIVQERFCGSHFDYYRRGPFADEDVLKIRNYNYPFAIRN